MNEETKMMLKRDPSMRYQMVIFHNRGTDEAPLWDVFGLVKEYYHDYIATYKTEGEAMEKAHKYWLPVMKGLSNSGGIAQTLEILREAGDNVWIDDE